jgi:hypothetical protein
MSGSMAEDMNPGPIDPRVLYAQELHISDDIWRGKVSLQHLNCN